MVARKSPRAGSDSAQGSRHWLYGLLCGVVLIAATPSALLAGLLLMPTVMAAVADRQPGRPIARAVLLFGLAGSCTPLNMLWRAGHGMDDAIAIGSDLHSIALAWVFQAGGWLLTQVVPMIIGLFAEAQDTLTLSRMRHRQQTLADEWDQGS
jgi:hypothetical protein